MVDLNSTSMPANSKQKMHN